jgi:amino acid transporter
MTDGSESLQEQIDEHEETRPAKFGTFAGVFRPTVMTIVGVILFVREGWVVGNAGLLGAWLIMGLAFAIVTLTALSMSCITTNIRIGAGGAYSIISQSLGLEVSGSVALPLFLAQAIAVTMYIFGFREGIVWIMEDIWGELLVSTFVIDAVTFGLVLVITFISTRFAFRVLSVILVVMIAAIGSVLGTFFFADTFQYAPTLWGNFPGAPEDGFQGTSFWVVFAVFFPAATGIMAGANMSGDLQEPRRAIPRGTLAAIGVSFVLYMLLAFWLSVVAPPNELVRNYTVMIDYALAPSLVVAGLLGATFSSALSSMVGAPRILQALGDQNVFPYGDWFAAQDEAGEPRNALIITAIIVGATILFRDLNAIAPMITMFFLIAYLMINLVVLIEQTLNMVSFRPRFEIPRWVPLLGTVGCMFAMFIISPSFGLIALTLVLGVYVYLTRRQINAPHGDIRSGLFVALAEWAAKSTSGLPTENERAWKPNMLLPFQDPREVRGTFGLVRDIAHPRGSVAMLGLESGGNSESMESTVAEMGKAFHDQGVYARWSTGTTDNFAHGVRTSIDTMAGMFFRPNYLFMRLPEKEERKQEVAEIVRKASRYSLGVGLFQSEPVAELGSRSIINVWMRPETLQTEIQFELGNVDLALLTAYKLKTNWDADARIVTAVEDADQAESAREFLENLVELGRLSDFEILIEESEFRTAIDRVPHADVDLFGLGEEPDFEFIDEMVARREAACLFVRDSGEENILA